MKARACRFSHGVQMRMPCRIALLMLHGRGALCRTASTECFLHSDLHGGMAARWIARRSIIESAMQLLVHTGNRSFAEMRIGHSQLHHCVGHASTPALHYRAAILVWLCGRAAPSWCSSASTGQWVAQNFRLRHPATFHPCTGRPPEEPYMGIWACVVLRRWVVSRAIRACRCC